MQKNTHFQRDFLQIWYFRHVIKRLECHEVPHLPRKTTWQPAWKHSKRRGFAASPIDATTPQEKPETRDETHGCRKTSISCETSSNFDIFNTLSNSLECHKVPHLPRKTTWQPAWTHSSRTNFPASPIDTATPQENQRLETRHVDAEKLAFRARLPTLFTVGNTTKGQVLQLPP